MSTADRVRHAAFAAKLRVLRGEHREFRALRAGERLDPRELEHRQLARARELVQLATTSPFYREHHAGIDAADLTDLGAFRRLPIVDKEHVRERFEDFRSAEATEATVRPAATGGSTGQPLRLLQDRRAMYRTLLWRALSWLDLSPADDVAHVWRAVRTPRQNALHAAQIFPTRSIQLNANRINDESLEAFLGDWERVRPRLLEGYVGGIVELAQFLADSGRTVPAPRAVVVTAAPITSTQKQLVGDVFRAPVIEHYRCGEVPWMAGECPAHEGLHVFADRRLFEILDEDGRPVGPGELGEVVVTDLMNRVFPLIRYRLGDKASWTGEPCSCGRTLPLIAPVRGRTSDNVRLPSGRVVAGEGLTAAFSPRPLAVKQFQVHQLADYSIVLRCIRGADPDADRLIAEVVDEIREHVRHEVPVRLEMVERIGHDRGKTRFVLSDVREGVPTA